MIGALLAGRALPWGLVAVLALVGWLAYDSATSRAQLAETEKKAAERVAETAMATADWQRDRFDAAIRALDIRQEQLEAAAEWIDERQADLDVMEKADGTDAHWLAEPLPPGVAGWVRRFTRQDSAAAGDDVPDAAAVPDQPDRKALATGE